MYHMHAAVLEGGVCSRHARSCTRLQMPLAWKKLRKDFWTTEINPRALQELFKKYIFLFFFNQTKASKICFKSDILAVVTFITRVNSHA